MGSLEMKKHTGVNTTKKRGWSPQQHLDRVYNRKTSEGVFCTLSSVSYQHKCDMDIIVYHHICVAVRLSFLFSSVCSHILNDLYFPFETTAVQAVLILLGEQWTPHSSWDQCSARPCCVSLTRVFKVQPTKSTKQSEQQMLEVSSSNYICSRNFNLTSLPTRKNFSQGWSCCVIGFCLSLTLINLRATITQSTHSRVLEAYSICENKYLLTKRSWPYSSWNVQMSDP